MSTKLTATALLALGAALASTACNERPDTDIDQTAEPPPMLEQEQQAERQQAQQPQAQQPMQGQPQAQQEAQQQQGVTVRTVADITGNPTHFVGEKVVIEGDVEEVHEGFGFRLDDESPLKGGIDDDLLIVGAKDASWKVDDGWDSTQVRVEGTIRPAGENLQTEIGRDFADDFKQEVEDEQVVLVAENVKRINR